MTFTFSNANGATISSGTNIIQTSGYSVIGKGAADYVYEASPKVNGSPATPASYLTANPRTSFVAADGRLFRLSLDQTISPFVLGAVGSPSVNIGLGSNYSAMPDDTAALQAFFDFCATRRVEIANWGGVFAVTATVFLGGALGQQQEVFDSTDSFDGSIMLVAKANIAGAVLQSRGRKLASYGPISIAGPDSSYPNYADRRFDFGILLEDQAQMQVFSTVSVTGARVAGVLVQSFKSDANDHYDESTRQYSNTFANEFGNCSFYACGSGSLHPASFLNTQYFDKGQIGNAGNYNQRTRMGVYAPPPQIVRDYGIPVHVTNIYRDDIHVVTEVNISNPAYMTIDVYPWVELNGLGATGHCSYVFGGGMVIVGGDTAIQTGKIASTNCSAGLVNASMYNGYFVATVQNNLIGLTLGTSPFNVALGGSAKGYFEGNKIDILYNMVDSPVGYFTIEAAHALDPGKIRRFARRKADNSLHNQPARRLNINTEGRWLEFQTARADDGQWNIGVAGFGGPNIPVPLHGDNSTIYAIWPSRKVDQDGDGPLTAQWVSDPSLVDLFGHRAQTFQITGTGAGRKPSGTLTVTPLLPDGSLDPGRKVNGGTPGVSAVFDAFSGPATVQVALDPADASNYLVSFLGGK